MSLSRAFTTRRSAKTTPDAASTSTPPPKRSLTTKHAFRAGTIRHKISAPVELISTTNMLSYNAPDIHPKSASSKSSTSSLSSPSGDESDHSPIGMDSPLTSPDGSVASSPSSPQPNHLSCYFGSPSRNSSSGDEASVPKIPQRAPSHTKKNAEMLARKRSTSRMSSPKNSISTVRSSINMFNVNVDSTDQSEPFGQELAKVSEVAEDFGISKETLAIVDEEEQELISKGLFKFRAEDYMNEIQGFFQSAFCDTRPNLSTSMWI